VQMAITGPITLARGSLIPSMTRVELVGNTPVELRPASEGFQGRNWAVAPMLGEGATSWEDATDGGRRPCVERPHGAQRRVQRPDPAGRLPCRRGAGLRADSRRCLVLVAGEYGLWHAQHPVDDWALDPTYNVCENEPGQCVQVSWIWSDDNMYGGTPGVPVDDWALDPGYSICLEEPGQCNRIGGPGGVGPLIAINPVAPIFSVVRTGTGDLSLAAAACPHGLAVWRLHRRYGDQQRSRL
jgi:hypothetical protein